MVKEQSPKEIGDYLYIEFYSKQSPSNGDVIGYCVINIESGIHYVDDDCMHADAERGRMSQ